eukprot:scaffold15504_cov56-Phaeocystis_antarctica.AAC.2
MLLLAPAAACAGRGPSSPTPTPNPRVSACSGVRRSCPIERAKVCSTPARVVSWLGLGLGPGSVLRVRLRANGLLVEQLTQLAPEVRVGARGGALHEHR